jgi:ribosomal-protein-alanine N-acetyltransferase
MISQTDLYTEQLLLRPFRAGDVDDALAYRNDREFSRYLSHLPQPFERHHAEALVALNMSDSWATSPTFGIKFAGKLIGTVNHEVDHPRAQRCWATQSGGPGGGRGFATEATRAMLRWSIETYGLTRIWASTDLENVRSQRVLEKLGMQREKIEDNEVYYGRSVGPSDFA